MLEKKCYSSEDLMLFNSLIIEKLKVAKEELLLLEEVKNSNDTNDTFKSFDKDEREEEVELKLNAITRQKKFINKLTLALQRTKDGTYGICHCPICQGKLIPEDRLLAALHVTKCINAKLS